MTTRTVATSLFSRDISDDDPSDSFWHDSVFSDTRADFPLFPFRFLDVTRSGRHFFQHIDYQELALEMILSGDVEYRTEEKSDICRKGHLYLIPPGSTVRFANISDVPRRKIALLFTGTHASLFADALGFRECMKIVPEDPDDIERRIRKIGAVLRRHRQPNGKIMLLGMELLLHLRQSIPQTKIPTELQRACHLMTSEIANAMLTTEDIARSVGLSVSDFRLKFYRTFGISPMKYLIRLRLEKAADLLKHSTLNIKTVAAQTGFNSYHSFSRTFSRHFGFAPGQLRTSAKISRSAKT